MFKILEVYLCDHARQLEYSKQYLLQVRCYFSSLSTSIHEANLKVVTKNNLLSSARVLLFTYPIRPYKHLKMHDRQSKIV